MVTRPSASCEVGGWTGCRSAPCQEMVRINKEKNSAAEESWRVVVPQEEAWMTQSSRLSFNQEERDREKKRERQTCRRQRRVGTHPLL